MIGLIFKCFKNLIAVLLFIIFIGVGYEYYQLRTQGYPHNTYLLNADYRLIPVKMEGRTETHVRATRSDTNVFFIYPIRELHLLNQWWLRLYPVAAMASEPKQSLGALHAAETLRARDQLIAAIDELQVRMDAEVSEVQQRMLQSEINRKLEAVQKLEASLQNMGADFKPSQPTSSADTLIVKVKELFDRILNRSHASPN